ncbi:MAG: hypothetical protein GEV07_01105 [Streptosporangiales bacterium]|nr:hypothetical protein [Streptosporangiales bacterium]
MNRPSRYVAVGFVLGVVATRRLGRRRRRRQRRATWQRAAFEAVTLAFAVREIAAELEAYEGRREIGSSQAGAVVDAGRERRALTAAGAVTDNDSER